MGKLVDLSQEVALHVVGAPEPLRIKAYRDSAIDFFTRTRAWRTDNVVFDMAESTDLYYISCLPRTEVIDATAVYLGEDKLLKATFEQQKRKGATGRYRITDDHLLQLFDDPGEDVSAQLSGRFVLVPTRTATDIVDAAAYKYAEALEAGALHRLYRIPNQPWSDASLAGFYGGTFEAAVDRYAAEAADGDMVGVPRKTGYGGY